MKQLSFLFFVIAALLYLPLTAVATAPTAIAPDSGTTVSHYRFELLGNSPVTYVNFGTNFYSDAFYVHNNRVNFTNIALGSAASSTQTFGVGVSNGNSTITAISANSVTTSVVCSALTCTTTFYYLSSTPVHTVDVTTSSVLTQIEQSQFKTLAEFNAASAPVVYRDSNSNYVQAKIPSSLTSTVVFHLDVDTGSGGGGGGGGSGGGNSFMATIEPVIFNALPGQTQTKTITITALHVSQASLQSITFSQNSHWFLVTGVPATRNGLLEDGLQFPITITLTLPQDWAPNPNEGDIIMTAKLNNMAGQNMQVATPVQIQDITPLGIDPIWILGGIVLLVIIAGLSGKKRRRYR